MDYFSPVKPTVLVVDDTPANLALLASLLRADYTVKVVNHGAKAITAVRDDPPDLILLDIVMPDINGYEVCRKLKADSITSKIPVIFLTSNTETHSEQLGMELGAADYITRPINPPILLSRVRAHLNLAASGKNLQVSNEYLEYEVLKRTQELVALQDVTILALASLAETRDADTGNHLHRTQHYLRAMGNELRTHVRFAEFLSPAIIDILFKCAPLHDIGKVGIPDRILLKPGRYEPHEYEIMKTHPALGLAAIENAQRSAKQSIEFLEIAKELVYSHHEKWDGTGYPQGIAGDAIPIPARLMALADVYDALISRRVYKEGMSHEQATQIIVAGRGQHFDPDVVDAFLALSEEFQAIAQRFADSDQDLLRKAAALGSMASSGTT
jgi:putative two-component system response regulator